MMWASLFYAFFVDFPSEDFFSSFLALPDGALKARLKSQAAVGWSVRDAPDESGRRAFSVRRIDPDACASLHASVRALNAEYVTCRTCMLASAFSDAVWSSICACAVRAV